MYVNTLEYKQVGHAAQKITYITSLGSMTLYNFTRHAHMNVHTLTLMHSQNTNTFL